MWKVLVFAFLFSFAVSQEISKKIDSQPGPSPLTSFFPISQVQFPRYSTFTGSSDLAALQQTNVLGNFQHRFHPPRLTQTTANSQPVFPPQTHITPQQQQDLRIAQYQHDLRVPQQQQDLRVQQQQQDLRVQQQQQDLRVQQQQQHLFQQQQQDLRVPQQQHQDLTVSQQQQDLRIPQSSVNQQDILRTSARQQQIWTPPQQQLNVHQNINLLPNVKSQIPFGSVQDQSIKNSFPSNAPHTIKFSISSQNYNPNQAKQFLGTPNSNPTSPPKTNPQITSQSNGRFTPGVTNTGVQPINHNTNIQQQTNFETSSSKVHRTSFQQLNPTSKPSFNINRIPSQTDTSVQYNVQNVQQLQNYRVQQPNDLYDKSFLKISNPSTERSNDFDVPKTSDPSALSHLNIDLAPKPVIQQSQFNQKIVGLPTPFPQNLPQRNNQNVQLGLNNVLASPSIVHTNQNIVHTSSQNNFHVESTPQQTIYSLPSIPPDYQIQTTQAPSALITQTYSLSQNPAQTISTLVHPTTPFPTPNDSLKYLRPEQISGKQHSNEVRQSITLTPSTPTPTIYSTIATTYSKPKPVVKEITINLNDKKILGTDIPSQLFIKEDRQKEFKEIQEQDEKQRLKKEKSHEDLINDQIQKLLQSQNLELVGKDKDLQTTKNLEYRPVKVGNDENEKAQSSTALPTLPELPEHIKKQYEIKLVHRDELFKQYDLPSDHILANDSSKVFLANGQHLEVVNFSKDGISNKVKIGSKEVPVGTTTTTKPPKVLFEELTKGVLPPGANFELIKHKGDGEVEKVTDLSNAKKATFVFLEEQPDGSVKIQGIKGNTNEEVEEKESVESLLKKIQEGSLKLPPSDKVNAGRLVGNEIPSSIAVSTEKTFSTKIPSTIAFQPTNDFPTSVSLYPEDHSSEKVSATYNSPFSVEVSSSLYKTTPEPPTTFSPGVNYIRSSTRLPNFRSRIHFSPTPSSIETSYTPTFGSKRLKPTASSIFRHSEIKRKSIKYVNGKIIKQQDDSEYPDSEILSHKPTEYRSQRLRVPQDVVAEESNVEEAPPLSAILKEKGLREMSKFLDQSGLDTILNETGPYTIFIPTDKAFKMLETQLGGTDKAEDKFRENPRLLSGLLLHHVVPGSFRVEDLQDEMTGVSLAGTQLRVNTYTTDEKRSNSEKVVTVNGAKISNENKDIAVPQGLAHSIDRVLFPLPVGDILQTLKGDRERRFTKFLKSLEYSGLSEILTGSKTYTVFAPTDKAFSVLTDTELDKLLTKREAAKTIVLRHITPGTLYTAGMNYLQVKDSMETGQKIVLKKEFGKIKANSAQIISSNIPATNGVIHVVETLL